MISICLTLRSTNPIGLTSLLYIACTRSNVNASDNVLYGICAVLGVVIFPISLLLFPNGPFTRPHPALWRIVFGSSLCYFLLLVFLLFCNMEQGRFYYFDIQCCTRIVNNKVNKQNTVC